MSTATVLQAAANRFSSVVGFAPIAVDGKIGAQTYTAVRAALSHLKNSFDIGDDTIDESALWLSKIRDTAALSVNAGPVGAFLNAAADEQGHGHVAAPIAPFVPAPIVSTAPIIPTSLPSSGTTASIVDAFKRLAMWQKILLGALAGFSLIWMIGRVKKARGLSGGSSRLYLYTYRNKHGSYSDLWASDAEHAREQIRRKKDRPSGFYTLSRVTNVPAREVA